MKQERICRIRLAYLMAMLACFGSNVNSETHKLAVSQRKPSKGEVTVEKAVESCEQFLHSFRFPVPKGVVPGVSLRRSSLGISKHYCVDYRSMYRFSVSVDNGKVFMFSNTGRQNEYATERRKKAYVVNGPENAKRYAKSLLELLGSKNRYRISHLKHGVESEWGDTGHTRSRLVRLRLEAYEHEYPLGTYDSCNLSINPVDGVLLGYGLRQTPYKIESFSTKLTIDKAISKAAATIKEYGVGTNRSGHWEHVQWVQTGKRLRPPRNESRLQYVCPNGKFGGLKYDEKESPIRLRLAWVLYYPGDEAVFVDAGNGRILGGISMPGYK